MSFPTATFLFAFLPITLFVYLALLPRFRNLWLLITSLLFYALGDPSHLPLLLLTAVLQYATALLMAKFPKYKRLFLILAVVCNLWLLFYYKYAAFAFSLFGVMIEAPALPIGISFYTFQAISYTVDVYRGEVVPEKKLTLFLTYLSLFPQLVAGPIVRYSEIDSALKTRSFSVSQFASGAYLFAVGLCKKLVIADTLAPLSSAFLENSPTLLSAWLSAIAFTLQIYFDFSGYSDMARGLGKLFSFEFPENFRYPYAARSITEFWRRWHITLSSFFKSYVYIPLGGNRRGKWRTYFNLLAVWLLTGLWHGADFTFLSWGLLYAVLLIFEKATRLKLPPVVGNLYTMLFVTVGFVLFRAPTLTDAFRQLAAMVGIRVPLYDGMSLSLLSDYAVFLLLSAALATPLVKRLSRRTSLSCITLARAVATPCLLFLSLFFLVGASSHPFLYFRF